MTAASSARPVVVLASRSHLSYALVNAVADSVDVAHVVFERRDLVRVLRRRWHRLGARRVMGQLLEVAFDRLLAGPQQRRRVQRILATFDTSPPDGRLPTSDVTTVNGPETAAVLDRYDPAVVVVAGTGLIAADVLDRPVTFLNLHCGLTPAYRGVHGAFWAVVEGHPERAGTTIHLIDAGIDTGGIVAQAPIPVDHGDGLRALVARQYAVGIPLMVDAVHRALGGSLVARSAVGPSQLYTSPTLWDHLRYVQQRRRHTTRSRGRRGG